MFLLSTLRAFREAYGGWAAGRGLTPVCSSSGGGAPGAAVQEPMECGTEQARRDERHFLPFFDGMAPTTPDSASARKLRDLFAGAKGGLRPAQLPPRLPSPVQQSRDQIIASSLKVQQRNADEVSTTTASNSSGARFAGSPTITSPNRNNSEEPTADLIAPAEGAPKEAAELGSSARSSASAAPNPKRTDEENDKDRQQQRIRPNPKSLASETISESSPADFLGSETRRRKPTTSDFTLLKVLGKGSYGTVMLVKSNEDKKLYAMKMLRKDNIVRRHQVQHTRTERAVLESIRHPFIVELYYAFQTAKKLYFVMEYCPGGELFFHLSRANRFSEGRVRFYAAEIVLALEFLHRLHIVYRDLKPENVLLDAEGHIRITDFGLSKGGIADNFSTKSLCGTPEYLAPEILNQQGHGKAVDWWSLGALIYEMLTGLPPFYSKDRERLFDNIRGGELRFPAFISPTAKDLLIGLFNRNPDRRLGGGRRDAAEVKEHLFFATVNWNDVFHKRITPPFRPILKSGTDVRNFNPEFVDSTIQNSEVQDSIMGADQSEDNLFPGFTFCGTNQQY